MPYYANRFSRIVPGIQLATFSPVSCLRTHALKYSNSFDCSSFFAAGSCQMIFSNCLKSIGKRRWCTQERERERERERGRRYMTASTCQWLGLGARTQLIFFIFQTTRWRFWISHGGAKINDGAESPYIPLFPLPRSNRRARLSRERSILDTSLFSVLQRCSPNKSIRIPKNNRRYTTLAVPRLSFWRR